jgi:hypothetical protein
LSRTDRFDKDKEVTTVLNFSVSRFHCGAALSAAIMSLALAGCSSAPVAYQGLASAGQLQPTKDSEVPFAFHSPTADLHSYSKIVIDPVAIYDGADNQFGTVAQEDRKSIADYMQQQFTQTLGSRYQIVAASEPGALRLHLTLAGIETSTPVISTVTHVAPAGLVINAGLQAAGLNGTFLGSVSYGAEIFDASSGSLLYAYVTTQTPDALDVTASFGALAAAREGVRIGAAHLRDKLSKDHAGQREATNE